MIAFRSPPWPKVQCFDPEKDAFHFPASPERLLQTHSSHTWKKQVDPPFRLGKKGMFVFAWKGRINQFRTKPEHLPSQVTFLALAVGSFFHSTSRRDPSVSCNVSASQQDGVQMLAGNSWMRLSTASSCTQQVPKRSHPGRFQRASPSCSQHQRFSSHWQSGHNNC